MTSWHEYHQYALENGGMDDDTPPIHTTPPCRVCGNPDAVICYPDDHSQTICPDCCPKAEHADGEMGHQWEHNPHERDHECRYCGILRRCTDFIEHD